MAPLLSFWHLIFASWEFMNSEVSVVVSILHLVVGVLLQ
jgi:hypothetical protein